MPLDEFVAIRDRVWFDNCPDRVDTHARIPLVRYLRRLSEQYLDELGRPVSTPSFRNGGEDALAYARLRWSWLCRALPPDLLRAARGIAPVDESPFSLSLTTERLLQEGGYAETHLHLGAAADFPLLWANFMRALAAEELREDLLKSGGACFDEGCAFAKWVLWAAIVRLVLANWLFDSDRVRYDSGWPDFLRNTWRRRMDAGMMHDGLRLISDFEQGQPGARPLRFARGRALYRLLMRPSPFLSNRRQSAVQLRAQNELGREKVF